MATLSGSVAYKPLTEWFEKSETRTARCVSDIHLHCMLSALYCLDKSLRKFHVFTCFYIESIE